MGRNVLFKRCFKRVIVRMLTHDRLRDVFPRMTLQLFKSRSLSPQCKVDCEYKEHYSCDKGDFSHGCRSYQPAQPQSEATKS
jgi:hypothetical protein